MVKAIQTIGLENGDSINDYDYFKTVDGDEIESFYDGRIEVMLTEKEAF